MRRLWLVVPALLLVLGAAAACSDRSGEEGVPSVSGDGEADNGAETELTDDEQAQAFVDCLRDQGLDVPDIDPNGEGGLPNLRELDIPRDELQPALQTCQELVGITGGQRDLDLDQETLDQMTEFAQCMRDNGVDVPDPDPNNGLGGIGAEIDPEDPDVQAALQACGELLEQFRPGAGGGQ